VGWVVGAVAQPLSASATTTIDPHLDADAGPDERARSIDMPPCYALRVDVGLIAP